MIFNLVQYLRNQFPAETFYPNANFLLSSQDEIPDRKVLVQESGGTRQMKTGFTEAAVQIVCFDIDTVTCRELITEIFEELRDRNGLLLPQVTVNGTIYNQVETGAIKAMARPQFLKIDDNGLATWIINFIISFLE